MKHEQDASYLESEESFNLGHRERLRERFEKHGGAALRDYEMLELLLTYAIPRRDVKDLAKRLLTRFGSLAKVLDAEVSDLRRVKGMGPRSAALVRLVKEFRIEYHAEEIKNQEALSSPNLVGDFAREKLAGLKDEAYMIIYLNTKNKVIHYDVTRSGTVDSAAIYPRTIVRGALDHNASGLILAHNHPSGDPQPSAADLTMTKMIMEACRTIGIRFLDHLVVGSAGFYSFRQKHLIED